MFDTIRHDIAVVLERDPAARSKIGIFFSYPGVHALIYYRMAHWAWENGFTGVGRFLSHLGRFLTGIEIHPGAVIGRGVFIDHGMGVVIGETAEVGDNVTLYQGVTLGGTSLNGGKRHPTLGEGVIVGAGAKILGPVQVGKNARIGSNAVVVQAVADETTVVGIPAQEIQPKEPDNGIKEPQDFCAYGMITNDLPAPLSRNFEAMQDMICSLKTRIEALEKEKALIQKKTVRKKTVRKTPVRKSPVKKATSAKKAAPAKTS